MNCTLTCPKGLNPAKAIAQIKNLMIERRISTTRRACQHSLPPGLPGSGAGTGISPRTRSPAGESARVVPL